MVVSESSVDQEGCGCPDLGPDLFGSGSVNHALRVGDVGYDTTHWEGFGKIIPQGGPKAEREATSERTGRSMVLSPSGVCDDGDGTAVGGYLLLPLPEHAPPVYCNQNNY